MCRHCGDIFNLRRSVKTCGCGKVAGKYLNDIDAEYTGDAVPLGIDNRSLHKAYILQNLLNNEPPPSKRECCKGREFKAFIIPVHATTLTTVESL